MSKRPIDKISGSTEDKHTSLLEHFRKNEVMEACPAEVPIEKKFHLFLDLFGETRQEVLSWVDPSTHMCFALTCKLFYNKRPRGVRTWEDFAAAILVADHEAQYHFARYELGIEVRTFELAAGPALALYGELGKLVGGLGKLPAQAIAHALRLRKGVPCKSLATQGREAAFPYLYRSTDVKWTSLVYTSDDHPTIAALALYAAAHGAPNKQYVRFYEKAHLDERFHYAPEIGIGMCHDAVAVAEEECFVERAHDTDAHHYVYAGALLAGNCPLLDATHDLRHHVAHDFTQCLLLDPTFASLEWHLNNVDLQWLASSWMWARVNDGAITSDDASAWRFGVSPAFNMTALRTELTRRNLPFAARHFAAAGQWLDLATVAWIAEQDAEALLAIDWRFVLPRYGWSRLTAEEKHSVVGLCISALEGLPAGAPQLSDFELIAILATSLWTSHSQRQRLAALLANTDPSVASGFADYITNRDVQEDQTYTYAWGDSCLDYDITNKRYIPWFYCRDIERLLALVPGALTTRHFTALLAKGDTIGADLACYVRMQLARSDLPDRSLMEEDVCKLQVGTEEEWPAAPSTVGMAKALLALFLYEHRERAVVPPADRLSALLEGFLVVLDTPQHIHPALEALLQHFGAHLTPADVRVVLKIANIAKNNGREMVFLPMGSQFDKDGSEDAEGPEEVVEDGDEEEGEASVVEEDEDEDEDVDVDEDEDGEEEEEEEEEEEDDEAVPFDTFVDWVRRYRLCITPEHLTEFALDREIAPESFRRLLARVGLSKELASKISLLLRATIPSDEGIQRTCDILELLTEYSGMHPPATTSYWIDPGYLA